VEKERCYTCGKRIDGSVFSIHLIEEGGDSGVFSETHCIFGNEVSSAVSRMAFGKYCSKCIRGMLPTLQQLKNEVNGLDKIMGYKEYLDELMKNNP
jgi:hypothetical protein